jgi:hypothetical protein
MIGSLLRWGVLGTLVGGSALAFVGSDKLKLYWENGKTSVLSAIDDMQGLESKLGLIRTQIAGLDDEVRGLKHDAVRTRVELERLNTEVGEREAALQKQALVLEKVSGLLDQGLDRYTIGRTVYTRDEVERDAAEKLSIYNVQAETLKSLKETLSTKEKALSIAQENVGRAEALRIELATKIGLLEAQLEKFRAREAFAATVEDVVCTDEIDSDLARAREMIRDFEQELEVKDRMLEEQLRAGPEQPASGIDYAPAASAGGEDLSMRSRHAIWGDAEQAAPAATATALQALVVVPVSH